MLRDPIHKIFSFNGRIRRVREMGPGPKFSPELIFLTLLMK